MSKAKSKVQRSPEGLVARASAKRVTEDIVQWVRWTIEDHEKEALEVLLEHKVKDPGGKAFREKTAEDRDSADPPYFALKILAACERAKLSLAELERTDLETRQETAELPTDIQSQHDLKVNSTAITDSCWLTLWLYFVMQHTGNMEIVEAEHSTITGKKVIEGGQKASIRTHGTAAERQAKTDARRDVVSKYEGQGYIRTKAIKAAAQELGCCEKTIRRALN